MDSMEPCRLPLVQRRFASTSDFRHRQILMQHQTSFRPIVDFLTGIGIPITEETLPSDTFLPGIALRAGGIVVDPDKLLWPGDLLHEAGHLAVLPGALRLQAHEDQPNAAEAEYSGELEAMAWAYAAAVELGLPGDVLIHEGGYNGKSRDLLEMYAFGVYPGLKGLCETGMTASRGFTPDCGPVQYPMMLKWLRD